MIDSEMLPVHQLKELLLSDEFQWKLARDIGRLGGQSFGVSKTTEELYIAPNLLDKFPDLTPELIESAEQNQRQFGPRASSHIKRLTDSRRTSAENYFGLLCGIYGMGKDGYDILPRVAHSEGDETNFFWSLAPYLAQELRFHNVSPSKIVETIFTWGEKDVPGTSEYVDLNAFGSFGFVLTTDPEDNSHKFAQGLARILCAEQDIFKKTIGKNNPMKVRNASLRLKLVELT